MSMNRRDFAKTSVGGLLALLVPGQALAKPKYPRYFAATSLPFAHSMIVRADNADTIICLYRDGPARDRIPATVYSLERTGVFREITEEVAEIRRKQHHRLLHPKGQHHDGVEYDDLYSNAVHVSPTRLRSMAVKVKRILASKGLKP